MNMNSSRVRREGENVKPRQREHDGRYIGVAAAVAPGEHLLPEGKGPAGSIIAHGSVADPNPTFRGQKQRVMVNSKTDALEWEYKNRRISESAYIAGRTYQGVLERSRPPASGAGQFRQGDRVDCIIAAELKMLNRITSAQDAVVMLDNSARVVGMLGGRILELALYNQKTIADIAVILSNRPPDRRVKDAYAVLFRTTLENLADHWAEQNASGRRPAPHERSLAGM